PSFLHGLRRRMGIHARRIVANSAGGRDYWRPFTDDTRIEIIPNIVSEPDADAALSLAGGVPEGAEVVLFAGGFRPEKNLLRLVEALAIVLKRRATVAVFCGDGPLRGALQARERELGIDPPIHYAGVVDNVSSWMKRAAVVV